MRKLILEEWLSIDGYAADRESKLDYFPSTEANRDSDLDQLKLMEEVDTILLGRNTYHLFVDFWPTSKSDPEILADKLNSIPKVVFSKTLNSAPWGKWPAARIVSGDPATEVRNLKEQPGKDLIMWGSITLAQTLIRENLIDEFRFHICPTAIGGGRLLFPDMDYYKNLKLVDVNKYDTGVVCLKYQA